VDDHEFSGLPRTRGTSVEQQLEDVWKILEDITRMQEILAQKIGRVREESNPAPPSEWIVSRPETTDRMHMSTPLVLPGESELNPGTASWGMTIGHIAQKDLSNLASETDPSQYRMSAVAVPPSSPQHPRISDWSAPEEVAQALLDLRNREYGGARQRGTRSGVMTWRGTTQQIGNIKER